MIIRNFETDKLLYYHLRIIVNGPQTTVHG